MIGPLGQTARHVRCYSTVVRNRLGGKRDGAAVFFLVNNKDIGTIAVGTYSPNVNALTVNHNRLKWAAHKRVGGMFT